MIPIPLYLVDMEDLKQFAKSKGAPEADDLNHWDIAFWSERLRESKYDINEVLKLTSLINNTPFSFTNNRHMYLYILQEELRPYFSLPKVMDGLFNLVKMLFGIDVEAADGLAPVRYNLNSKLSISFIIWDFVSFYSLQESQLEQRIIHTLSNCRMIQENYVKTLCVCMCVKKRMR